MTKKMSTFARMVVPRSMEFIILIKILMQRNIEISISTLVAFVCNAKSFVIAIIFCFLFFSTENLDGLAIFGIFSIVSLVVCDQSLPEICPNTELFLVRIFPHSD